jgi:hypothetical protein
MESHLVLTPAEIDRRTLREFVLTQGGTWQEHLHQGVIERGPAAVYVCVESPSLEGRPVPRGHDPGGVPPSLVVLYVGGGAGSGDLAHQLEDMMVATWGGSVERGS